MSGKIKKYIPRALEDELSRLFRLYPVTVITGPRQSGKSTLCRHHFPQYKYINPDSAICL